MPNLPILYKLGLIGHTLKHSFSQEYFTNFFNKQELPITYSNIELQNINSVRSFLNSTDYIGLNVTIPYKESVLNWIPSENHSDEVKAVGAANCLIHKNSEWYAHNTDIIGFKYLLDKHKIQSNNALILGTGGAAKAISHVLNTKKINHLFVSRNPIHDKETNYNQLEKYMDSHLLIVNTTPLGTFPHIDTSPTIPFNLLTPNHTVIDLIYNPEKTKLLKLSNLQGCHIINGYEMLIKQAEASWAIWQSQLILPSS